MGFDFIGDPDFVANSGPSRILYR